MARKLGRPKAGHEALTRERILLAALALIDEHGVAALSMRRLAGMLGVDPMAIYHHVAGKSAVIGGVVELVFRDFQPPATPHSAWQDQLRAFAQAYHALALTHPNLVLYLATDAAPAATGALAANEVLYAALAAAGLTPVNVLRAADLVVDFLNGFALAIQARHTNQCSERHALLAELNRRPAEHFPAMHAVLSSIPEHELSADMHAGLEIIVTGIAALAEKAQPS